MVTEVIKKPALIPAIPVSGKTPFSHAHITILEGAQGSGKTGTAVARVIDAYDLDCMAIYCRENLGIKCEVKSYARRQRVAKIKYNGKKKLIRIPSSYKLCSALQIHANFHFYGVPFYYYKNFGSILAGLRSGKIRDGYLVVDEYYIGGNAREGQKQLAKQLVKQSFQYRKKQLEVIYITPMARLIDWTARMLPTEHIQCSYNEKTRKITLSIRKKGQQGTKEISYDASRYWPNYWTNETINE